MADQADVRRIVLAKALQTASPRSCNVGSPVCRAQSPIVRDQALIASAGIEYSAV